MSISATKRPISREEYLANERDSTTKNEYLDGHIYAMAGASREHNIITVNISTILNLQLREKPCEVYANDMRLKVTATGLYTYPDVAVACNQPQFEDSHLDTLLNPTIIFEVLSDSTEAYDRGEKFAHYRRIESLKEYVLVAQDQIRIEHFLRHGDQWLLTELNSMDKVLRLNSIDCELPLRDIYAKIIFPAHKKLQKI